jgi:hypothetical protein
MRDSWGRERVSVRVGRAMEECPACVFLLQSASVVRFTSTPGGSVTRNTAAIFWRPEIVDARVDWSVELFVDQMTGNGNQWVIGCTCSEFHGWLHCQ